MAYLTGTVTIGSNWATDQSTSMDSALTSNGWTFVYGVTVSTSVYKVYRSPAASNIQGADLYFATRITSGTTFSYTIFETWDNGNLLAGNYPPSSNNVVPNANGTHSGVPVVISSASILWENLNTLSAATYTYHININGNRAIFAYYNLTGTAQQNALYVGLHTPLSANSFPLIAIRLDTGSASSASTSEGLITREMINSAGTSNWNIQMPYGTSYASSAGNTSYGLNSSSASSLSYSFPIGSYPTSRVAFCASAVQRILGGASEVKNGVLFDLVSNYNGVNTRLGGDTLAVTAGETTYNYVKMQTSSAAFSVPWMPTF